MFWKRTRDLEPGDELQATVSSRACYHRPGGTGFPLCGGLVMPWTSAPHVVLGHSYPLSQIRVDLCPIWG